MTQSYMHAGIMRDSSGVVGLRFIQMVFNATFPLALPYSQVWPYLVRVTAVQRGCPAEAACVAILHAYYEGMWMSRL